jgi:hypothetical protein
MISRVDISRSAWRPGTGDLGLPRVTCPLQASPSVADQESADAPLEVTPHLYIDSLSCLPESRDSHCFTFLTSLSAMSFLGGAECSTGANPLSQFTKHVQDDKSLQRDRLVGRGPGGLQEGMRSQQMGGGSDGVSIATEATQE